MKKLTTYALFSLILTLLSSTPILAYYHSSLIDVSVVSDHGYTLEKFPVSHEGRKEKAYIKAKKGMAYGLRISNTSNKRIGLVIAVDGRNIISGKKSFLSNHERMYILNPNETQTFDGWRTGKNQVNRFYFTKSKYSYATAWGDNSAMGVIAVAAFKEDKKHLLKKKHENKQTKRHSDKNKAGTGFGEESYSPSINVRFKPRRVAGFKSFLKYEWKNTLCKKGILDCHHHGHYSQNRFWDDNEYAPYPRRRQKIQ